MKTMKNRIERVNSLIARELSLILHEVLAEMEFFFSIVAVETTTDLSETKVYIVCQDKNLKQIIEPQIGAIQKQLNRKLVLKFIPKIKFVYED